MSNAEFWFLAPGETLSQTREENADFSIRIGNVYLAPKIQNMSTPILKISESSLPDHQVKTSLDRTINATTGLGRGFKFWYSFCGRDKERILNDKFNKNNLKYTMEKLETTTLKSHKLDAAAVSELLANPEAKRTLSSRRRSVFMVSGVMFAEKLHVEQSVNRNLSYDLRGGVSIPLITGAGLGYSSRNEHTLETSYRPESEWVLLAYQILRIDLDLKNTEATTKLYGNTKGALLGEGLRSGVDSDWVVEAFEAGSVEVVSSPVGEADLNDLYAASRTIEEYKLTEEPSDESGYASGGYGHHESTDIKLVHVSKKRLSQ